MKIVSATFFIALILLKIVSAGSGGHAHAAEPTVNLGPIIIQAQSLLASLGYAPGPADGKSGQRTRAAIKYFEEDVSAKKTGKVNVKLVKRLQKWVQLVAIMELHLKALGYEVGKIDGVLGKRSYLALKNFQNSQNLSPTGRVSPNLFNALWLQARDDPAATKFLCKHYSSIHSVSRIISWCKQAAKLGDEISSAIVAQLQHRMANQPKVLPSRGFFQERNFTKREKEASITHLKDLGKALDSLKVLKLLYIYQRFKKGDCKELEEIDDKATKGSASAQHFLSDLYHQGLCVEKNDIIAIKWLKLAAAQGEKPAQFDLGLFYQRGWGTPKRINKAVHWYETAGNQGEVRAQYSLGKIFEAGEGVIQDYAVARRWYEKAANQGHNKSIIRLGYMYLKGRGVKTDFANAFIWFEKSAKQGFKLGQHLTSIFLAGGMGTPKDLIQAHKWANLATTSDNSEISKVAISQRAKVEKLMKPHQVSSAQKLARSWKPKSLLKEFPPKQQPPALSSIPAETADRLTQGEALAKLLSLGVPINRDTLRKVVKKDNLGLLKLFHRAGADLNTGLGNYRDLSPLYLSIDWGARNVYRYLMDNAADINKRSLRSGMAPLVRAIAWGRWDIVNELLDAGADVSQSPETLPGKGSSLIKGTPLSYAVQFSENPVLIYRLLNAGARTDERYLHGSTPLHQAVSAGFVENSRVLIKAGANPNSTNKFGITPIFEAVKVKTLTKVEILRLLIKGGASVKQIDQSKPSILFWASYKGRTDLINLFIRSGADVNERYYFKDDTTPMIVSEDPILKEVTKNGSTPLHVAAKLGHFSAVKALIKAGANHSIVVRMGAKSHSVISLAKQSGNTTLYKFLKHR